MMTMYTIVLLTTLSCVYLANANNCAAPTFSCRFNNPCDPECVPGQQFYPGAGPRKYVECVEGQCIDRRCWGIGRIGRTEWDQDAGLCLTRDGQEPRCANRHHNCDDRNPCAPTLCEAGVQAFLGPTDGQYVECAAEGGLCLIGDCHPGWCWHKATYTCGPC